MTLRFNSIPQVETSHQAIPLPFLVRLFTQALGSFIDTVLRGLDRILGGLARPALKPVPVRVPVNVPRRRPL